MECENYCEKELGSPNSTCGHAKDCQNYKPKAHPLAVAVSEIISRVESYLPDLILRETITDLYKLRFESIKWALKKVEEKHGFVPYTADHHCQLAGHKDWIVE